MDNSIYQAALEGLELQKQRIEEQIKHVKSLLAGKSKASAAAAPPAEESKDKTKKRRKLSAVARKRIAEAQKKRWAAFRKTQPAEES